MGEHTKEKLVIIEKWLNEKYGESESRALDYIYSKEYKELYKPRNLEADYVNNIDGKSVYVDVIAPNDEWRTIIGKMVSFSANAERAKEDYEVWIVTNFNDDPKVAQAEGVEKVKSVEGWKMYFQEMKGLINDTLKSDLTGRVKIFHLEEDNLKLIC